MDLPASSRHPHRSWTATLDSSTIPLDWPKFIMTLTATCGLLMLLVLLQIG